jgi:kinesin family protein 2/24
MHIDLQHNNELSKMTTTSKQPSPASNSTLLLKSRVSSREANSARSDLPFKDRLRPGIVVSYSVSPEREAALGLPDGIKLAVLLCPAEAADGDSKDVSGHAVNSKEAERLKNGENGVTNNRRYLCALMVSGQADDTYELSLWRQIVIDVGSMDKEIHMEYDSATRYYYVAV